MFKSEHLQEKWAPVLNHDELAPIKDNYRRAVTSVILENQEKTLAENARFLSEAAPTNSTGADISNWDPILISLVRRAMPNLIAYDVAGVQPMTGPTGLVFAMRSRYSSQAGTEAFYNEADTTFSGTGSQTGTNPALLNDVAAGSNYTTGTAFSTAIAEALGDSAGNPFAEMAFSIEKFSVEAKSRALKAEYSMELAQDLKAIHGLDAETELANILSSEILSEINREVVRTLYRIAKEGAQTDVATAGNFDLDVDSNGRWSVEKFKGLMFQIERDANVISQLTRRGRGNTIICSSDVASALNQAGKLDYTPALNNNLNDDDTGSTFAGVLNGRYRVYIDPYAANAAAKQFYIVGYKGSSFADAGFFYCPYVPLQMVRAVDSNSFQPKIGFKTRYGMTSNPFASGGTPFANDAARLAANSNVYYRRVQVLNLL